MSKKYLKNFYVRKVLEKNCKNISKLKNILKNSKIIFEISKNPKKISQKFWKSFTIKIIQFKKIRLKNSKKITKFQKKFIKSEKNSSLEFISSQKGVPTPQKPFTLVNYSPHASGSRSITTKPLKLKRLLTTTTKKSQDNPQTQGPTLYTYLILSKTNSHKNYRSTLYITRQY